MSRRILLVDDDSAILEGLQIALGDRYAVLTASDGEDAWNLLRREPVDLVVLDMVMPRLDGEGLLRAVRSEWPGIPAIAVSAHHGLLERAGRAGAQACLSKPFKIQELEEKIEELLGHGSPSGSAGGSFAPSAGDPDREASGSSHGSR